MEKQDRPRFLVRHKGETWCIERLSKISPKHRNWKVYPDFEAALKALKEWADK